MIKFRKSVSFNVHDSKVVKGERISISLGVKKRCDLTLAAVLRFGSKGVTLDDLTEHLSGRFKGAYTTSDVRTACTKLVANSFLVVRGGKFHATKNALERWRKADKVIV